MAWNRKQNLTSSHNDREMIGTICNDHLFGGSGDDLLSGRRGDDVLVGGGGNDAIRGGAGNDLLSGQRGDDMLIGGVGNDVIRGGAGKDTVVYRLGFDAADSVNLGTGLDTVRVVAEPGQVRLTLSTFQIGDGSPNDSGTLTNEDGGLAVRLQAEDSAGSLTGPVSRYDDEGISFIGSRGVTFEVRDLPTGSLRGTEDGFHIVRLGSSGDDVFNDARSSLRLFLNGGAGDDTLTGGSGNDLIVGIDGNDRLEGGRGDDELVGLDGSDTYVFAGAPGNDTIFTYESGTDRIDLSAYGIDMNDVQTAAAGPHTLVQVDSNSDGSFDFEILLIGSGPPLAEDFLF